MVSSLPRPARLMLASAALLAACGLGAALVAGPGAAAAAEGDVYLPFALRGFGGPFPTAIVVTPEAPEPSPRATEPTEMPTATLTPAGPLPTGTSTGTASAPTPTDAGPEVRFPRNPETIILQIGRTDTTQSTQVFEEMNGTPWFTLYGDGRVITGAELFDNEQRLREDRADDADIQRWLGAVVHAADIYRLQANYHHPRASTPEVHLYVYTNDGTKRVSLRSFRQFEQWGVPDDLPEADKVEALVAFVRALEAEVDSVSPADATPFAPDCYTILSQEMYGFEHMANQFEPWEHGLNIRTVAEAAPTAASNYEGKVVGHKFVDGDLGREIEALVRPQWEYWFSDENLAAAFRIGRTPYAVGARQEVPGGSMFLPRDGFDSRGAFWYRRDPGSGSCPGLPRRLAAQDDGPTWLQRWLGLPARLADRSVGRW